MQPFPKLIDETLAGVSGVIRFIVRARDGDVTDNNNLPNIYMRGRRVGKIPTSSSNVVPDDKIGDFSFAVDGSYIYFLVSNAGSPQWRRAALATW